MVSARAAQQAASQSSNWRPTRNWRDVSGVRWRIVAADLHDGWLLLTARGSDSEAELRLRAVTPGGLPAHIVVEQRSAESIAATAVLQAAKRS